MITKMLKTALLIVLAATLSLAAQSRVIESKIKTSSECDKCKARIEKAVNAMDGVKSSVLDVPTKILTVKYDESILSLDKIREKISATGYDADDVKSDKRAYKRLPSCCQIGGHKEE